ncbi:MAG: D-glycero-beta-D-manno-heptose 1-phosphate adenylyltransferase [Bacteroidia bacterium]|nr:D-glycero-beta-D-manno-heptose 1-phosphate adenylyltransferase [Bacteroidia bacterium]MCZ2248640.1 D-glycero-beta-D-manno-heptose 1-phosphate adenylyltransferase [Bacteroidia bacterium]
MDYLQVLKNKIVDSTALSRIIENYRLKNQSIVFTNGCFDLLHQGHVTYLAQAASYGNRLIVGINSDSSVKKLKGSHRPIQDQDSRCLIMASMHVVSAVIIFDEDTPLELIKLIKPDYLVKGGDWTPDKIVGAKEVSEYGGQIISIPFVEGFSTTAIESKIKSGF